MSRPIDAPEWASDASYPAGTDPWSATDTKLEPTSGEKGTGITPQTGFGAQQMNWLLNNKAEWLKHLDDALAGGVFLQGDDFMYATLEPWWTAIGSPGFVDDSATNGNGALHLTPASSVAQGCYGTYKFRTDVDFRWSCRVRVASLAATGAVSLGIAIGSGTDQAGFQYSTTDSYWRVSTNFTSADTLTSTAPSAAYQLLEMRKIGSDTLFYVDGTLINTLATSYSATANNLYLAANTSSGSAANVRVDSIKILTDR